MVEGPSFERLMLEAHARSLGVSREEACKDFASVYAMKRLSNGEDVANAVTFLLSKRARQMTGMDLPVDGGWAEL
jgi:NAD(P)-dependent dehydrogenase (short-subunit alcohol dehydrogenase family)